MAPEKIELPPKYYLEYFQYLLTFVQKKYQHILNENEQQFLSGFDALTEDEKCLFIRFANRAGSFFRTEKLKYAEIEDIPEVLNSLINKGFVEPLSSKHLPQAYEVLDIFNKSELIFLAKMLNLETRGKASLKKEEVLDWLLEVGNWEEIHFLLNEKDFSAIHAVQHSVVKVCFEEEVQLLKFLFFGTRHGDMSEFVTRDLGFQSYEKYDEDKMVAYFQTRQEVEDKLKVSLAREDFYLMQEAKIEYLEIFNWFMDWTETHRKELTEIAIPTFERFTLKVGAYLEKLKALDEALIVFRLTEQSPSRERQVRILDKLKNKEEAKALCELILAEPQNADEHFFAEDYLNRLEAALQKKKSKKAITQHLHGSESITIDLIWKRQVEMGVIDYYEQHGKKATFTENHLWRSLFGLLFWDIIFDTDTLAIHHPLQRSPSDLFKPTFFEKRKERMEERLLMLEDIDATTIYIHNIFFEKYGITNPLVDWYGGLFPLILTLLEKISPEQISLIMLEMARNLRENVRGFPDLMMWSDGEYCFVEVKSPTDSLSNQQLYWQRFFEKINVQSKVLRVEWQKPNLDEFL
ncbi:VRR-NUC domain-containing protein [Arcicella lustrica]|uniref:phosphodiesterase I n=1 Tax=Arcicella lustrica TaxID=2984196 RepID=A0ABU5SLL9_9BACT|nr:VRR-NUC domain-containing protein [Arcicella sp. DC25W]MEA5428209.1 VRR-NUC domain-containing protein [Arcicella sp. DC25W]